MSENIAKTRLPKWITLKQPSDIESILKVTPVDYSHYTRIHHIGDVQGAFDPLNDYFAAHGIKDDELYLFVGDYLDRGPQNAEVMSWLLDNYNRPNFIFIEGNHEAHLRSWTKGTTARSIQFNQATALELEAAGIKPKKVHGSIYSLREFVLYTYREKTVFTSHGGISTLPTELILVHSSQIIKGAGSYDEADDCDNSFAHTTDQNTYQFHGHRNRFESPIQVNERCFNLEGKVEFGGELRVVTLDGAGFTDQSVKSHVDATASLIEPISGQAASGGGAAIKTTTQLVEQLRRSGDIYEKIQADTSISSFNFNRDVFYKKTWNDLNVHARGLFIDTSTNQIVARAYEKFFNIGERTETQPDVLIKKLVFPVTAWVKSNGYLGLIGFDHELNQLLFASKSSLTSEFAGWLKQQFDALVPLGSVTRQSVIEYLKGDKNSSNCGRTLVFEVIEPELDPHVVTYKLASLVLLDVVRNQVQFKSESYSERTRIAKLIGCETKQKARVIKDAGALIDWLEQTKQFDYTYYETPIEGFVLEDKTGSMVKVKLPWYAFWRQMRTQLQRLQSVKLTQQPAYEINPKLAEEFLTFLNQQPPDVIAAASIVTLRDKFYNQ